MLPDHVLDEVTPVLSRIARRPTLSLDDVLAGVEIVPRRAYGMNVAAASVRLRHAVASRNGSVADAHLLALAWLPEADIWSHDRDFAGTGWPSWSSANLVPALGAAVAPVSDH